MTGYPTTGHGGDYAVDPITGTETSITIIGNGAVLDGQGKGILFCVTAGATLIVFNVTMRNGLAESNFGGAIFVQLDDSKVGGIVKLNSCTFEGNSAATGGAIFIDAGSTLVAMNCIFRNNSAPFNGDGGAIHVEGAGQGISKGGFATTTSCTFSGNFACTLDGCEKFATGGAINLANRLTAPAGGATAIIRGCNFEQPIASNKNDVARDINTNNVTFVCPEGYSGASVQMQGREAVLIPPQELQCTPTEFRLRS
jgi:predicted outer membrane repeat protein